MHMKNQYYFIILMLLLMPGWVQAQKENNVWAFGHGAGLDFNGGAPALIGTGMQTDAGCASVSDHNGMLLFYTNGDTVWDRTHAPMLNGTGLITASNFQNVVVVPFVNDTNRYYIFHLTCTDTAGSLYYSVVDRTLNGGLGGIVTGQKNQLLWDGNARGGLGSGMTTVAGDHCNIWLINHIAGLPTNNNNRFVVHEIDVNGIGANPVISQSGAYTGSSAYLAGVLKIAPDRRKLASTTFTIGSWNGVTQDYSALECYDFDPATGVVSNAVTLDSTGGFFLNVLGAGFSPDGSKLYSTTPFLPLMISNSGGVWQFDLSLPTIAPIRASKTAVGFGSFGSDVATGPDGKVYVSLGWSFMPVNTIDRIDAPDAAGTACGYNAGPLSLPANTTITASFPNPVVYPIQDTQSFRHDTLICPGAQVQLQAPGGFFRYYWQGERSYDTMMSVTAPGTYWVTYENHCRRITDTFHVGLIVLDAGLTDTALCPDAFPFTLDAAAANIVGTQYTWQDGSTGPVFSAPGPGSYAVRMQFEGCYAADTVEIEEKPVPVFSLGADTAICADQPLLLRSPFAADAYLWQDGSTEAGLSASSEGTYWLAATVDGCTGSDSIRVAVNNCDCKAFVPNAFSPNGDGRNDVYLPLVVCGTYVVKYELSIYNRWGQRIFYSHDAGKGWDGTYNGQMADAGVYFFTLQYGADQHRDRFLKKGELTLLR